MHRALLTATLFLPAILHAQTPTHAPDGGAHERLQSVVILPKPGAPFSATVVTDWTRTLADGSTVTLHNVRFVARDSAGHVFQERRFLTPTGNTVQPPLSSLEYADPTRHEFYECLPTTKVCRVSTDNRPTTIAKALPASLSNQNGSVTVEPLGEQRIANLDAVGSREITTVNPGASGYEHPEPTIKEFWYSPRLEVNLIVKRFEPRGGIENFALKNIDLAEPDPKLFEPPTGYKIIHMDQP